MEIIINYAFLLALVIQISEQDSLCSYYYLVVANCVRLAEHENIATADVPPPFMRAELLRT
jgi:hypothetical protein